MITLSALPPGGPSTRLAQPRCEIVREEVVELRCQPERVRLPPPPPRKVDEMDRTLQWLGLIPNDRYVLRRVVGLRAVTHFESRKPLSWRKISARLGANAYAVKGWHEKGILIVTRRLNALSIKPQDDLEI